MEDTFYGDNFLPEAIRGKLSKKDIEMLNPIVLAYVGDAVYEVFIRNVIVSRGIWQPKRLHKESVSFVKAQAQAELLEAVKEDFSEEESDIVRRGRNAKSGTIPKNAGMMDYKNATGFESLIGYLYLLGRYGRLKEIFEKVLIARENIENTKG